MLRSRPRQLALWCLGRTCFAKRNQISDALGEDGAPHTREVRIAPRPQAASCAAHSAALLSTSPAKRWATARAAARISTILMGFSAA